MLKPSAQPVFLPVANSSVAWPWSWSGLPTISAICALAGDVGYLPTMSYCGVFAATCST